MTPARFILLFIAPLLMVLSSPLFCFSYTRNIVEQRGHVLCGVSTGLPGFSSIDSQGTWRGLDVDVCRAVAAAVLGDAEKVKYVALLPKERATTLLSGDVDILARNMVWDITRDTSLNMNFVAVTFHDFQGFLVRKSNTAKSVLELKDFTVCVQSGTSHEENLADYLQESQLKYKTVVSATPDQIIKDFQEGRCEVITGGRAQLQSMRSMMEQPAETAFLPEVITNLPLGPAVRHGDDVWYDIVKWSVFAMIYAEQLQLTSENIDSVTGSPNRTIQRFLGLAGIGGKGMGLDQDWAHRIIKQVGNYGESYSRNLGETSPLKLKRGLNNLWNNGGILFAPPFR